MPTDQQILLQRWREGSITPDEMRELTAILAEPDARAALRRDWFLEAALPQALAASAVIVRTPKPTWVARWRGWMVGLLPSEDQRQEVGLGALQLWARISFAALALGLISAGWFVWPQPHAIAADTDAEQMAQIIFQRHFNSH